MPILQCNNTRDYLKPFGYNALAVPKANVQPLTMLGKRGRRYTPIGPLVGTFRPGPSALPSPIRQRVANLSGAASNGLGIELGIDILGSVIGALSGSSLGIKAAYNRARTIKFEFGDVMENSVDINALDQYLAVTPVDPSIGPFLKDALDRDEVLVVVAAVDSQRISVEATAQGNSSLDLDIPVVQKLVGGKVVVSGSAASSSVLTYTSTEMPLAFGVSVVRLVFDDGFFQTLKLVKAGGVQVANAGGPDTEPAQVFVEEEIEL